jgi:hypothetical protein
LSTLLPPRHWQCLHRQFTQTNGSVLAPPEIERFEARNESLTFQFKSAGVSNLRITSELESFITPALLPRAQIQQAILIALQEVMLRQLTLARHLCHTCMSLHRTPNSVSDK